MVSASRFRPSPTNTFFSEMAPGQTSTEWFVRDDSGTRGPFSEAQLREVVQQSSDPQLLVKQGNSEWHPAQVIRQKMEQLAARGIYVRCGKVAEGPFTISKARELLRTVSVDGIKVRTGERGEWVPASQWLDAIRKLERKRQRTARKPSVTTGAERPSDEDVIAEATLIEEEPAEPVLVQAVLVEPDPVLEAIPVAIAVDPGHGRPPAQPVHRAPSSAMPFAPSPAMQSASTPAHVPRPASYPRPQNPRTQSNSGVGGLILKLGSVALSVCIVLGIVGLKFLRVGGKAALRQQQQQQRDESRQQLGPSGSRTVIASSPIERSRIQHRLPSSRTGSTAPIAPPRPTPAIPVRTGPPTVVAGMLFRPQFATSDGVVDAGTAFAAKIEGQQSTYVISALHLFGPAGGLDRDIPAAALSARWQGLSLEDCKSHREHSDVPMQPVPLTLAKPLPNRSPQGDVAVCEVPNAERYGLQPLPLARELAPEGERVWLVSEVIGSSSLIHPATIEGTEDGWLLYRFDRSIELRATSGAPVVDGRGRVVAVNAGGGEQGGVTFGVGTPTTHFASSVAYRR